MALADDILALCDRATAELNAVYDYLFHSQQAWLLANATLASNPAQVFHNPVTGTTISGAQLSVLSARYAEKQLLEATFLQFLSVFEVFVGDLLRLWLTAHPRAIGGKTLKFEDALDAGDMPTLVSQVVDHEVAEVTYRSPRTVFQYLEKRIGLALPPPAEIDRLAEAKATRDVIVHNRGVINDAYLLKAGALARHTAGQFVDIPNPYHRDRWELTAKLVADFSAGALAKA